MSKPIIEITKNAWKKMGSIMKKSNNSTGFSFGVKSGGCNGFNFNLKLINENDKEKLILQKPNVLNNNNVNIFIEPISEIYLIGTTIDYVKEDYDKGIFESKFTYNISKDIASSCGCGISFSPKNTDSNS